MKTKFILALLMMVFFIVPLGFIMLSTGCSPKAQSSDIFGPTPPDSVMVVDTLRIPSPDTCSLQVCDSLDCRQHEIDWTLNVTDPGNYSLTFTASTGCENHDQKLDVYVDGQKYCWDLDHSKELEIEQYLKGYVHVTIAAVKSCGDKVRDTEVCLSVKGPQCPK
jgi:hypothetical protein